MARTLACACESVTPGLSRPTPIKPSLPRSVNAFGIELGNMRSSMPAGTHKSGPKIADIPMKRGGATPTTVSTTLLILSSRPTMSEAAPKRCCHAA